MRATARWAALATALLAAACAPGRSVVAVTVDSVPQLDDVTRLAVTARWMGRSTDTFFVDVNGPIPPVRRFAIAFPVDVRGDVQITVEARRGDAVLASAHHTLPLAPSERRDVTITLGGATGGDGGAGDMSTDLTMPDAAVPPPDLTLADLLGADLTIVPDLRLPDLAMPDQAMPDFAPAPDFRPIVDLGGADLVNRPAFVTPSAGTSVTASPIALTVADLDRDGLLDTAVLVSGGTIAVSHGNGGMTLPSPSLYATGATPRGIASVDLDRDGWLDLVTTGSGGLSVLLSDRAGGYKAVVTYAILAQPSAVVVADFDRDGLPDVAVTEPSVKSVTVLRGKGDGTFQNKLTFTFATLSPTPLAVADLNRDGKADLVTVDLSTGTVGIMLGNGDGAFSMLAPPTPLGGNLARVALADLDGDGVVDLALADRGSARVFTLGGVGDGSFTGSNLLVTTSLPYTLIAADINADGLPDLVTASMNNTVSVYYNTGSFTFSAPAVNDTGSSGVNGLAAGDFNRDGTFDVVATSASSADISLLINGLPPVTKMSFTAGIESDIGMTMTSVTAGDINRDGKIDLVVAGPPGLVPLLGSGDGRFVLGSGVAAALTKVVLADIDRNGALDVVASDGASNIKVFLGSGSGMFVTPFSYASGANGGALVTGDFNRDGRLDVATAQSSAGAAAVLLADSNDMLGVAASYATSSAAIGIAAGDINRDGILDLVVGRSGNTNALMLVGLTGGTFAAATNITAAQAPSGGMLIADLDRNGAPDVIAGGPANVTTLLSAGTAGTRSLLTNCNPTNEIALADLNRDGILDLIYAGSRVGYALGVGDGSFGGVADLATTYSSQSMVVLDLNGDGKPDIAAINDAARKITVYLNTSN